MGDDDKVRALAKHLGCEGVQLVGASVKPCPFCGASYRNNCGIANHFTGFRYARSTDATIRATVGVISGRNATSRPPLSVKLNNCASISSPDFVL